MNNIIPPNLDTSANDSGPSTSEGEPVADVQSVAEDLIRERILFVFSVYPAISRSMLQSAVGSSLAPAVWSPVLQKLLDRGVLEQKTTFKTTPSGRSQSFVLLMKAGTLYKISGE